MLLRVNVSHTDNSKILKKKVIRDADTLNKSVSCKSNFRGVRTRSDKTDTNEKKCPF